VEAKESKKLESRQEAKSDQGYVKLTRLHAPIPKTAEAENAAQKQNPAEADEVINCTSILQNEQGSHRLLAQKPNQNLRNLHKTPKHVLRLTRAREANTMIRKDGNQARAT
jgi:hypothetical protein